MMNDADFENRRNVLLAMIQLELSMAEFYKTCADISKEDKVLWQTLSQAETSHAKNIETMIQILTKKRERFEAGRPFNLIALNTAMSGLKENVRRVSQGEVDRYKMLVMAKDIEESVLESHYAEFIKTNDVEYQTLMKVILAETYEHKKIIQKTLDDLKTKV